MTGPDDGSFTQAFLGAMMLRIGLVIAAMGLSYAGSELGERSDAAWAPFLGALGGLALGAVLAVLVLRRLGSRPGA